MKRLACLFLVASTLGLVACGGTSEPSMDEPASSDALANRRDAVEVGDDDDGKTIVVEQGKDIRLTLGETASTGYRWGVVSADRSFGYPTPLEGTPIGATGPVGAKGKRQFVWSTSSPFLTPDASTHLVKLEYRRSFENAAEPAAKSFSMKVQIKAPGAAPADGALPTLFLGQGDDGKTLDVKVDQKVTVRLPENRTTGYRWYVDSIDRSLGSPDETHEASASDAVGAGGQATFSWTPSQLAIGKHNVTLKKSRGAEGAAAEHFEFVLDVTD